MTSLGLRVFSQNRDDIESPFSGCWEGQGRKTVEVLSTTTRAGQLVQVVLTIIGLPLAPIVNTFDASIRVG